MYKFSAKENSFYPESMLGEYKKLPADLLTVDEKTFIKYACTAPPKGMVRGSVGGLPAWVEEDKAEPEDPAIVNGRKKHSLISTAMEDIKPLQFAVDLGIASDVEKSNLDAMKRYVVDVNRVDVSKKSPRWPKRPVV